MENLKKAVGDAGTFLSRAVQVNLHLLFVVAVVVVVVVVIVSVVVVVADVAISFLYFKSFKC